MRSGSAKKKGSACRPLVASNKSNKLSGRPLILLLTLLTSPGLILAETLAGAYLTVPCPIGAGFYSARISFLSPSDERNGPILFSTEAVYVAKVIAMLMFV